MEPRKTARCAVLGALLLSVSALMGGCGGNDAEEPAVALSDIDRDRNDLCFDAKTLPPGFDLATRDPAYAAGIIEDSAYEEIGRVASGVHQYVFFPPSAPAEDADGILTPEELAAAHAQAAREVAAMPFTAAVCRVDLYEAVSGAKEGLRAEKGAISSDGTLVDLTFADITFGSDGFATTYLAPSSRVAAEVTFRRSNVIGHVTLTVDCGAIDGPRCITLRLMAGSLGKLLVARVEERLAIPPLATSVETGEATREAAEAACPEQDYLGCIDEYQRRAAGTTPVALCRTQYGGWSFEPPAGKPGDRCADGEAHIVTIVGG